MESVETSKYRTRNLVIADELDGKRALAWCEKNKIFLFRWFAKKEVDAVGARNENCIAQIFPPRTARQSRTLVT